VEGWEEGRKWMIWEEMEGRRGKERGRGTEEEREGYQGIAIGHSREFFGEDSEREKDQRLHDIAMHVQEGTDLTQPILTLNTSFHINSQKI